MGGVLSSLIMNKKKDMTNKESLLGKDKLGEDISKHFKWMFKRKNEILTMGTMTNLNKEIEKKFKKFCIKCFPEPIEKGEKILAISIDFEEALSFILSEVIPMVRKEALKAQREEMIKEIEDNLVFVKERVFWKAKPEIKGLDLREMYDAKKVDDIIKHLKGRIIDYLNKGGGK
jgi:hypothetical protein